MTNHNHINAQRVETLLDGINDALAMMADGKIRDVKAILLLQHLALKIVDQNPSNITI